MNIKGIFERKKIVQLPKSVADRIAAGEVVDRPLSIVKELVENSIDAGSDSIVIEIKNGGKSYIRITDNGCGIPQQDIETAFFRHATNKIVTDSDLFEISTLGFRGEALASIAAVTRTQMITKIPEAAAGVKICVEGGIITEKIPIGASDGTTIIVTDLFYNTPAREKFMKKDSTESALIIDFISKLALAYPQIRLKLINNERTLFATNGKGDILENIYIIYGKEIAENLLELSTSRNYMQLKAFISNPVYNKSTKRNQFFFVNGRYIMSKILEEGVREGYGDKMPEGRQPVAFVFLNISPESVDVNIHPNKKELRFHDPAGVKTFLKESVFSCLNTKEGVGTIPVDSILKNNLEAVAGNKPEQNQKLFERSDSKEEILTQGEFRITGSDAIKASKFRINTDKVNIIKLSETNDFDEISDGPKTFDSVEAIHNSAGDIQKVYNSVVNQTALDQPPQVPQEAHISPDSEASKTDNQASVPVATEISEEPSIYKFDNNNDNPTVQAIASKPKFDIASLKIMGVIFDTYIAACDPETFYLIDQHAAHERVFYEQFLNEFNSGDAVPQMILAPFIKEIPFYVQEDGAEWMRFLEKSGYIIEPFGGKAYIIKGIPSYMDIAQAERFLDDYIDNISEATDFKDRTAIDRIIMHSCKSAVKAHDKLSTDEISALLKSLAFTKNPYSCPHGRPVIIKMRQKDMEKMFKRI